MLQHNNEWRSILITKVSHPLKHWFSPFIFVSYAPYSLSFNTWQIFSLFLFHNSFVVLSLKSVVYRLLIYKGNSTNCCFSIYLLGWETLVILFISGYSWVILPQRKFYFEGDVQRKLSCPQSSNSRPRKCPLRCLCRRND